MNEITLNPGVIPQGFCPGSEQERYNMYILLTTGNFSSDIAVISVTTPSVDNQNKVWFKIDTNGALVGTFTFSAGAWVRPHELPPGPNSMRYIWVGALIDLETYDGGSAGAITATTGPFFEYDPDFDNKIPRGAGTVVVGTNASELSSGASATDQVRGVYFVKRSARVYRTA